MDDVFGLIDAAGVVKMTGGWHISIRADLVNPTPQKPHRLDYGLVLNEPGGTRVLGFDNKHSYDGAGPEEPFDHEHKHGKPGQSFKYEYATAWVLLTDFWDRVDEFIAYHRERTGEELRFLDEGEVG